MITNVSQRWRHRVAKYRPAGEPIVTSAFEVVAIPDDTTARGFVVAHHYAASYPAARFRFGLYRRAELVGVAVFSHPCNDRVLAVLPGKPIESCELGRFVLLDDVPANGESWFLARCFEQLRARGLVGVVSFSDPVARDSLDGATVFPGHIGTIYQASNAVYVGRGARGTLHLLPDGTSLNRRSIEKLRAMHRGWQYVVAMLERHGASPLGNHDPAAWATKWIARLTRKLRHAGNHKYAWTLQKRDRRHLPASLPYPKVTELFPGFVG